MWHWVAISFWFGVWRSGLCDLGKGRGFRSWLEIEEGLDGVQVLYIYSFFFWSECFLFYGSFSGDVPGERACGIAISFGIDVLF